MGRVGYVQHTCIKYFAYVPAFRLTDKLRENAVRPTVLFTNTINIILTEVKRK